MTLLRRVYYNGLYVVAELEDTLPTGKYIFGNDPFVMNAENLQVRIKNRKDLGLDTTEDQKALDKIYSHKDYKP